MYNMVSGFTKWKKKKINVDDNEETQEGDFHSVETMKPFCVVTCWVTHC